MRSTTGLSAELRMVNFVLSMSFLKRFLKFQVQFFFTETYMSHKISSSKIFCSFSYIRLHFIIRFLELAESDYKLPHVCLSVYPSAWKNSAST